MMSTSDFLHLNTQYECSFASVLNVLTHRSVNEAYARLPHWKEDVKIRLQKPDTHSKMTHAYLYVESRFGLVPWIPTQVELLSNDWQITVESFTE